MDRPVGFSTDLKKPIMLLDCRRVEVDLVRLTFPKWTGKPIEHDYGGKPVVMYNGEPMFAELAIRRMLINAGWSAQWISGSY